MKKNIFFYWRELWRVLTAKNLAKTKIPKYWVKGSKEAESMVEHSPYEPEGATWREHLTRFHLIHYVIKYKLLVPILLVAEALLDKHLIKGIDSKKHNQYLKAFNDAYDKAYKDWKKFYGTKKHNKHVQFIKEAALTLEWYDTAYRNFNSMLCSRIAYNVQQKGVPDLEVFDTSFEEALYEFSCYNLRGHRGKPDVEDLGHEEYEKRYLDGKSIHLLRVIKKIILTSAHNDGAVQKFLNLFMAALTLEVMEKCVVNGEMNVLLYTRNIRNPATYYKLYERVTMIPATKDQPARNILDSLVEPVNKKILEKGKGLYKKNYW